MLDYMRSAFSRRKTVKKITLGICAMDKKARSKAMVDILGQLREDLFEVIIFGDECILNTPVEDWPVVEALVAFYSKNFPLAKAIQYAELRKPFMFNNLKVQELLQDRRKVYEVCLNKSLVLYKLIYIYTL